MSTIVSYLPGFTDGWVRFNRTGEATQFAQTFVSDKLFSLTDVSVLIKMQRTSPISSFGTLYVSIQTTAGGLPTGISVSTGTYDLDTLPMSGNYDVPKTPVNVTMSAYEIQAGTTYALVTRAPSATPTYPPIVIEQWGTVLSGYASGNVCEYVTEWTTRSDVGDFQFRINGVADPEEYVDVTSSITTSGLVGTGTITGTAYLTATPSELFDPPVATPYNTMATKRRLVALAKNSFWYEDL